MIDIATILRKTFVARAEHYETATSTNDVAAADPQPARDGLPLLVVADRQTAARGRSGKRWWTGPGALAMSLAVDARMVAAGARSPLVALATALAVVEAVRPRLPGRRVGIHWPNDVMADEMKLAGILVEVPADRRHIIGIGLNTNNTAADAPIEAQRGVATLRDLSGKRHDHTELLVDLLERLEDEFRRLREGPETVVARADAVCLQRGRTVTLQCGQRAATGTCLGIRADGAIVLETARGEEAFHSGTTGGAPSGA